MWKLVSKAVYVLVLLIVFVYLVVYDSVNKYLEEETFFSEKKIVSDLSKPPAVTVMVQNLNGHGGWKKNSSSEEQSSDHLFISVFCNTSEQYHKVVDCIDRETYSLEETILSIKNGDKFGVRPNLSTEMVLEFYLNSSIDVEYRITVHDPQFFWQSYNGLTIPKATTSLKRGENFMVVAATQYSELDRAEARCEAEEGYSFTACARTAINRIIGCRTPWDTWTEASTIPLCTNVSQLLKYEELMIRLSEYELDRLVNLTECLKPCHYTVYSVVGEILTGRQNYTSVFIQTAQSTNTFKREILGIAIKHFSC